MSNWHHKIRGNRIIYSKLIQTIQVFQEKFPDFGNSTTLLVTKPHFKNPKTSCIHTEKQIFKEHWSFTSLNKLDNWVHAINKKLKQFENLQAVCEARIIGSSCPGNCLVPLDWKQPIYWEKKKETKKEVATLRRLGFTMFSLQSHLNPAY